MSAPIIDPTRSILGFLEGQEFEFQPYASGDPYIWFCTGALPPGLTFHSDTGLISGAATVSGVWVLRLQAQNYDGTSADGIVTIGIQPGPKPRNGRPTILVEINTGAIYVPGPDGGWLPVIDEDNKAYPALWLKRGDNEPILVQFANGDAYADLPLTSLKLTVKHTEPERVIGEFGGLASASKMKRIPGSRPELLRYAIVGQMIGSALDSALDDEEADDGTFFYGLADIEWQMPNDLDIGPETLIRTSNTFVVGCERDMDRNPTVATP